MDKNVIDLSLRIASMRTELLRNQTVKRFWVIRQHLRHYHISGLKSLQITNHSQSIPLGVLTAVSGTSLGCIRSYYFSSTKSSALYMVQPIIWS